ncbi:protein ORF45 [Anguillid herpesvirus 1]|uniref:Protein ORF45 n=1 Tax=Anguillid herpesvirus 1 TaxID=150286 RepID=A0A8E5ESZ6_9VIRU|nr:protein ORF45 [Anguillid herpesvirus 1]UWI83619.1 protein ORF45 [Anguillid herpesvirus 1]
MKRTASFLTEECPPPKKSLLSALFNDLCNGTKTTALPPALKMVELEAMFYDESSTQTSVIKDETDTFRAACSLGAVGPISAVEPPRLLPASEGPNRSSVILKNHLAWIKAQKGPAKPPCVYFLGIQTKKRMGRSLPKVVYADHSSFVGSASDLGPTKNIICKTDVKIFFEAFLFPDRLEYTTNIQTDKLKTLSLDKLECSPDQDKIFLTMIETVNSFRAAAYYGGSTETVSCVIAFVAAYSQNCVQAGPEHIRITDMEKKTRKFNFTFYIAPMQTQFSDQQVWQSTMCVMKTDVTNYAAPIKPRERFACHVTQQNSCAPISEGREKRLTIEHFFLGADDAGWRSFVTQDTKLALYYETLYNPETVITWVINWAFHTMGPGFPSLFHQYFDEQPNRGWCYTDPAGSKWILEACDIVDPGETDLMVDLTRTEPYEPDGVKPFGWQTVKDDVLDKFNVPHRVAFDNTAAWPENCTNQAVDPAAQGLAPLTDLHTIHVVSTEAHQISAFIGADRPPQKLKDKKQVEPAISLTQACSNFVDKFYGQVFTNINGVPASEDQLGKFFNRGTDFSVLTKSKELTFLRVPLLLDLTSFDHKVADDLPEGSIAADNVGVAYVSVRVKLDQILGRMAYLADNVHNKTLSASYMTTLCKAAAELTDRVDADRTLTTLFTKCYGFCQSLTYRMLPLSYGVSIDTLLSRAHHQVDAFQANWAFLNAPELKAACGLGGVDEGPRIDPGFKPTSLGPSRVHGNKTPIGHDLFAFHGPTSQVYTTYNANLVSDKLKNGESRQPSDTTLLLSQAHVYYWCRNPTGNAAKVLGTKSLMAVVYQQAEDPSIPNTFTGEFLRPNGAVDRYQVYGQTYFSTRTLNHKVGVLPHLGPGVLKDLTLEDGVDLMALIQPAPPNKDKLKQFNMILYNKDVDDGVGTGPIVYFAQFSTSNNHANYCESRSKRTKKKQESLIRPKSTHTNSPTTFFCMLNTSRRSFLSLSKLHNGHEAEVHQSLYGIKNLSKKYTKNERWYIGHTLKKGRATLDDLTGTEKVLKAVIWLMYTVVPAFKRHVDGTKYFSRVNLFNSKSVQQQSSPADVCSICANTLNDRSCPGIQGPAFSIKEENSAYTELKNQYESLQKEYELLKSSCSVNVLNG